MVRPSFLCCLGSCVALAACSASGEDAAAQWVESRSPLVVPNDPSLVPMLVDTPPAVFTAKHVIDPFAPGRIGQPLSSVGEIQGELGDGKRWQFAASSVDSLRVVGFLELKGRYIGVIEGSAGSANVKVGDRLGNQQAVIVDISKQGIRLRQIDGSESWMPISRRSR